MTWWNCQLWWVCFSDPSTQPSSRHGIRRQLAVNVQYKEENLFAHSNFQNALCPSSENQYLSIGSRFESLKIQHASSMFSTCSIYLSLPDKCLLLTRILGLVSLNSTAQYQSSAMIIAASVVAMVILLRGNLTPAYSCGMARNGLQHLCGIALDSLMCHPSWN